MSNVFLFDFGGVVGSESYFGWLKKNISNFEARRAEFEEIAEKGDLGKVTPESFFKLVSDATNIPLQNVWTEIYEPVSINMEVVSLIQQLKKDNVVVLFSNYMGQLLRNILNKRKVMDLFDYIFISSEQQVKKPDARAFSLVLEKVNAQENNTFFIDDRLENIKAGQKLGIDSLIFTNAQQLTNDLNSRHLLRSY